MCYKLALLCEQSKESRKEPHEVIAADVTRSILDAYEAGDLITMCAWCRRVEIGDEWLLAPRAALTAIDARYTLSHSICPACALVRPAQVA